MFRSTDAGESWLIKTQGFYRTLLSTYFLDANTGFAGGYDYNYQSSNFGMILKTTNGGLNWSQIYTSAGVYSAFTTFGFINATTGYAAGGLYATMGFIAKTTNAGTNWIQQNYFYTAITEMMFADVNTGYLATTTGAILKTTSGGDNWFNNYYFFNHRLRSLSCVNSSLVYAVGDSGYVLKTTNGGTNWDSLQIGFLHNLNSVYFVNNNTGYIAADSGTILKTANAGLAWIKTTLDTSYKFQKIRFIDINAGYACGYGGIIAGTTNGGTNWQVQSSPTNNDLLSVFFVNSTTGFTVGNFGTILKTTTGGEPIGIRPISQRIPESFKLYQNYPNPFNPSTKIKFSLPIPSKGGVKLEVYDVLGRLVASLIPPLWGGQEGLKPGTYEVEWDATNYPSGIYFYRLTAGSYVQTNKMVLLK
jgi:photosystem II stability/assembly factor-like uncharacterized protein